jgi:hypothetical protein
LGDEGSDEGWRRYWDAQEEEEDVIDRWTIGKKVEESWEELRDREEESDDLGTHLSVGFSGVERTRLTSGPLLPLRRVPFTRAQ